jgi:FdrA protein
MEILGMTAPDFSAGLAPVVRAAIARLELDRSAVRGLFSGGTLCYEAMTVMVPRLGPIHSNTPLRPEWGLPPPPGAHACLDLGEEEFTRGRPHPMIDPEPRAEMIAGEAARPETAVVLVDVVLGYGAHPDPASVLAPACAEAASRPGGPAVVAYVLGTDRDPQDYAGQRRQMEEAGCILAPSSARAALMAAAIAARSPDIAGETP